MQACCILRARRGVDLDNSMRIAFVTARGDVFGGSSLHVHDMARRLADDGHTVKVFVGGTPDMDVPKRLAANGIDLECIPEMGREISLRKDSSATLSLRRGIKAFAPDLVSTHTSKAGALGRFAALGLGVPVLYTPHCWSFADGFPRAGMYRWIEAILAPLATRIITVCEQERRLGLDLGVGKAEKTICIHNGVIDSVNESAGRADDESGRATNILMVARFEDQKDQDLLLRALADNRELEWALTLVGDGPRKEACMHLARDLGIESRVEFAGYSDRVEDYLNRADIFALITHWEGFPRSVLEAMRAGLPVIVSDVGGCSESVFDGETGRVVRYGDQQDLADALHELLTNRERRKSMGASARIAYLHRFTFDVMYRKYVDLYRSVSEAGNRQLIMRTKEE
jgi:glycosyltransferase involved in cell wall biosynthesis